MTITKIETMKTDVNTRIGGGHSRTPPLPCRFLFKICFLAFVMNACFLGLAGCGREKVINRPGYEIRVKKLDGRLALKTRMNIYKEMNLSEERRATLRDEITSQFSDNIFFSISITLTGDPRKRITPANDIEYGVGADEYSSNLRELSFGLSEKIYIAGKNGKKIFPSVYNFERSFGLTKDRVLMIAFPKSSLIDEKSDIELVIDKVGPIVHREKLRFAV